MNIRRGSWAHRPCARRAFAGTCALAGTVLGVCSGAHGQPSLTRIRGPVGLHHTPASGVSRDGAVVVGTVDVTNHEDYRAYRWTPDGGMQELGMLPGHRYSMSAGVSDDGLTVVGTSYSAATGHRVFLWTTETGMQDIAPGEALGVSGDGRVVLISPDGPAWAVLWSEDAQARTLDLPEGALSAVAHAMTPDARTVIGSAVYPDDTTRTLRWTAESGLQVIPLPNGMTFMEPGHVSPDGMVITGRVYPDGSPEHSAAFRWTPSAGTEILAQPDGAFHAWGTAAGPGGAMLAGFAGFEGGSAAFLWTRGLGSVSLESHLRSLGLGFTMNLWELQNVRAISADGSTLVGWGRYRDLPYHGWVLRLNGCPADFDGDATFSSQDFFAFLTAFFALDPSADFNADGEIGSTDFFEFLSVYFQGC